MSHHPLWGRQSIAALALLLCLWVLVVLLMSQCVQAVDSVLPAFLR